MSVSLWEMLLISQQVVDRGGGGGGSVGVGLLVCDMDTGENSDL